MFISKKFSVSVLAAFFLIASVVKAPEANAWTSATTSVSVFGGGGDEESASTAVDASGNVYTAGYFQGIVDFDPGAGVTNLTSAGGYDVFISKLNSTGDLVWAKSFGGTGTDFGYEIAVDNSGNVYTTGSFQETVDFDPGAGVANLVSAGGWDGFILKVNSFGESSLSTNSYIVTAAMTPANGGSVLSTNNNDGTWGLVATANPGYVFTSWGCSDSQTPTSTTLATTTITPSANTTCTATFTLIAAVKIKELSPEKGSIRGGTLVTIKGTGFSNSATVSVDGVLVTPISPTGSTKIVIRTPAHAKGTVSIVVTNPDTGSSRYNFTYVKDDEKGKGKS